MASGRICFVPSRAKRSSINGFSDMAVASTNLKRDAGNTEESFCEWIQLKDVNVASFHMVVLTSAYTAPYLIALSSTLSVDPLMSGE